MVSDEIVRSSVYIEIKDPVGVSSNTWIPSSGRVIRVMSFGAYECGSAVAVAVSVAGTMGLEGVGAGSGVTMDGQCRACLCHPDHHRPLPEQLYFYCTSLEVVMDDGLPNILCHDCYDLLNSLCYFKQQCVRSDAMLKQSIKLLSHSTQLKDKEMKTDFCTIENRVIKSSETTNAIKHEDEQTFTNSKDCDKIGDLHKSDKYLNNNSNANTDSNDDGSSKIEKQKKKYKQSNKRSSTMLYCQKCDKSFYKYIKLEAHMRKHFGMKPDSTICCSQCDKKFTTEKNLKSHLRVHTGERKYKCKTCGKAFAYLNVLKNHERAHAGIKKYICHQCGKKFVQLTNLNTHLLQHTGEKPYICEQCNRRFGQPSEYKLHLLRHTGVKNFACNLCPLRFYTNASLQKHVGVHSDARPHACKTCEKRFKTRSYMIIHNRTHTGERPFSCDYCPMKFMSGKDRRNHHKTHTGEKAPPKARKPKIQNNTPHVQQSTEILQNDPQSQQIHNQNMDSTLNQLVTNIPVNSSYVPQQNIHSLSPVKVLPKQNCPYEKLIEKQSPNNFFRIPPAGKTQCSYINPMY